MTNPQPGRPRIITRQQHAELIARDMKEATLQAQIIGTATRLGWLSYHTHDSRRSTAGYPDLHLVHPGRRISALVELKTQKGRLTPEQQRWLTALAEAGVNVAVWRPILMTTGVIADWLADPSTPIPSS